MRLEGYLLRMTKQEFGHEQFSFLPIEIVLDTGSCFLISSIVRVPGEPYRQGIQEGRNYTRGPQTDCKKS